MPPVKTGVLHSLLEYVSRPPGYKKLLHHWGQYKTGENILTHDWNLCIILDACRFDLLQTIFGTEWIPPAGGEWNTIISIESATQPWIKKTFNINKNAPVEPVTYVCANPYSVEARGSSVVNHIDEVWQYGDEPVLGTVPPEVVTDRAIHHYRHQDGRVIAHYIQPHLPALIQKNGALCRRFEDEPNNEWSENWLGQKSQSESIFDRLPGEWTIPEKEPTDFWNRLRFGDLDKETAWKAFEANLNIVLEELNTLLRAVDAEKVIITSDHGNAFGEWGIYGHPYHMPFEVLRKVPYIVTSANRELNYEPNSYNMDETTDQKEMLEALGYV